MHIMNRTSPFAGKCLQILFSQLAKCLLDLGGGAFTSISLRMMHNVLFASKLWLNDAMQYGQEQHNYPRHSLSRAKRRMSCFFFLCTAEMGGYGFDLNGSRQVDQNHNHDFLTQPILIRSETTAMGSASHTSEMFPHHSSGCTNQLFY